MISADILHKKKTVKDVSKDYPIQWIQYRRSFDELAKLHTRYDTEIVVYSEDTIHKIYQYPTDISYIFEDVYCSDMDVLHKYYSGQYRYIFSPYRPMFGEKKLSYITLDNESKSEGRKRQG